MQVNYMTTTVITTTAPLSSPLSVVSENSEDTSPLNRLSVDGNSLSMDNEGGSPARKDYRAERRVESSPRKGISRYNIQPSTRPRLIRWRTVDEDYDNTMPLSHIMVRDIQLFPSLTLSIFPDLIMSINATMYYMHLYISYHVQTVLSIIYISHHVL